MGYTIFSIIYIVILGVLDMKLLIGIDRTMTTYIFVYIAFISRIWYPFSTLGFSINPNALVYIECFTTGITLFLFFSRVLDIGFKVYWINVVILIILRIILIILLKLDESRYIYVYEDEEDYIIDEE